MTSSFGERDLQTLLKTLRVVTHPSTFTFITVPRGSELPLSVMNASSRLDESIYMLFREAEGTTLILENASQSIEQLQNNADYQSCTVSPVTWKMLTLNVHSSLEAVGFIAVISRALADDNISCNTVAAYYHDHIFMAEDKVEQAVSVIEDIARQANADIQTT